jgi:hypothetical protein
VVQGVKAGEKKRTSGVVYEPPDLYTTETSTPAILHQMLLSMNNCQRSTEGENMYFIRLGMETAAPPQNILDRYVSDRIVFRVHPRRLWTKRKWLMHSALETGMSRQTVLLSAATLPARRVPVRGPSLPQNCRQRVAV